MKSTNKLVGLEAEEVFAEMPKIDKLFRHEKRIKAMQRDERRQKRKAAKASNDIKGGFEVAPAEDNEEDKEEEGKLEGLSDAKRKKILEARELIKAGMGNNATTESTTKYDGFEVVSRADRRLIPAKARDTSTSITSREPWTTLKKRKEETTTRMLESTFRFHRFWDSAKTTSST